MVLKPLIHSQNMLAVVLKFIADFRILASLYWLRERSTTCIWVFLPFSRATVIVWHDCTLYIPFWISKEEAAFFGIAVCFLREMSIFGNKMLHFFPNEKRIPNTDLYQTTQLITTVCQQNKSFLIAWWLSEVSRSEVLRKVQDGGWKRRKPLNPLNSVGLIWNFPHCFGNWRFIGNGLGDHSHYGTSDWHRCISSY